MDLRFDEKYTNAVRVISPFGELRVLFTGRDAGEVKDGRTVLHGKRYFHAYVEAGADGGREIPPVLVNNVPYYISAHIYNDPDKGPTWGPHPDDRNAQSLYMNRTDHTARTDASPAARKKFKEALPEIIAQVLGTETGRKALERGEAIALLAAIDRSYEKAVEKRDEFQEVKADLELAYIAYENRFHVHIRDRHPEVK